MNRVLADLHARARDQSAKRPGNVSTSMFVERLQHKHALRQDCRQHDNFDVSPIASLKELPRGLGVLFLVLYQVADNQIGINEPSLGAHRLSARPNAALAAAWRISAKVIFRPFLLDSTPFSDRVPGCTRIVTASPSTTYSSLSPGLIRNAWRISPGIVVCPFLVTVECAMSYSLLCGPLLTS